MRASFADQVACGAKHGCAKIQLSSERAGQWSWTVLVDPDVMRGEQPPDSTSAGSELSGFVCACVHL